MYVTLRKHAQLHTTYTGTYKCSGYTGGIKTITPQYGQTIFNIWRHTPLPHCSTQRRREYNSPENALKPHIIYCTFIYIVKSVNLIFFRIAGLRTPAPSPNQSTLRHGGAQYSTGLHVLLRTGRDITNVADLGRNSQKALPRRSHNHQ